MNVIPTVISERYTYRYFYAAVCKHPFAYFRIPLQDFLERLETRSTVVLEFLSPSNAGI